MTTNTGFFADSRDTLNTTQFHILAVDDDPDHLALTRRWLEKAGYRVSAVSNGDAALTSLELNRPDLVLTDLVMDGMDGLKLLSRIHRHDPVLPVAILSGQAQVPDAIEAAQLGVSGFLTKPIDAATLTEAVADMVRQAGEREPVAQTDFDAGIIYRGPAMSALLERARLVARHDSSVLLSGPTGSGKEVIAHAIHQASPRKQGPFVSLNCSALPEQLLESELFGHEKGAFTGALQRHEGLFRSANQGTLFLDEVGDMPLLLQAKLLRVLQDLQVRPLGSTQSFPVNVRIISATNKDLETLVESGEFREDLYYRLNVVPLDLPSLDQRREDIPLLLNHFLGKMDPQQPKRFSPDALNYLRSIAWPGNVRQLRNLVEHCHVLSGGDIIPLDLARSALRNKAAVIPPLDQARGEFERRYLVSVLRACGGKVSEAARMAGRNRTEFYKLLKRHQLEAADFRNSASQDN